MSHVLIVDPIAVFDPYDVEREQLQAAGFGLSIAAVRRQRRSSSAPETPK
jgi:hypothetical protein